MNDFFFFFSFFFVKWGLKFCFFIDRVLDVLFMSTSHQLCESFPSLSYSADCPLIKCWPYPSQIWPGPSTHIKTAHEKVRISRHFRRNLSDVWCIIFWVLQTKRFCHKIQFIVLFLFLCAFISCPKPRAKKANQSVWLIFFFPSSMLIMALVWIENIEFYSRMNTHKRMTSCPSL